jgi:hypothetical protein
LHPAHSRQPIIAGRIKKQTLSQGASLCALAGEEMGVGWRYESEVQIDFDDFLAAARRIQRIA